MLVDNQREAIKNRITYLQQRVEDIMLKLGYHRAIFDKKFNDYYQEMDILVGYLDNNRYGEIRHY